MRVVEINMVSNGSTGHIMLNIAKMLRDNGDDVKTFSAYIHNPAYKHLPNPPENHKYFGSYFENAIHSILGKLTGLNGCFSYIGTKKLIKEIKRFNPDVLHLHNLHTFCINLPMLFRYVKKNDVKLIWTLHDCWTFTGHCPHFVMAKCDKWKTGCHRCPQPKVYPKMYLDASKIMYKNKKKWFCGVKDMTLVTPSKWLANLTRESFLSEYPVRVINNGIDLSIFNPSGGEDFREKFKLENKKIVLGVVGSWERRKGIDVFIELSERLSDDYRVVVVGLDKKPSPNSNERLIFVPRTANRAELAQIYSSADLFLNPTREDTFPTVNIEALACGIPVLTFKTGGSPEIIDESCGSVVDVDDIDALEKEVLRICTDKPYSQEACLERARKFDMNDRFRDYVQLYEEVINK